MTKVPLRLPAAWRCRAWPLALALLCLAAPLRDAKADFARYQIDPVHFSIGFLTMHLGYEKVLGMFLSGKGSFLFDEAAPAVKEIDVSIDADSVFTNDEKRDNHLRSDQFLDAEASPVIHFVGKEATATSATTGVVKGDLTIRNVTRPVELQVTLNKVGPYPFGEGPPYVVGVSVRTTIKRSEFGMTYAVENGWVGDEVDVIIELEAIRQ